MGKGLESDVSNWLLVQVTEVPFYPAQFVIEVIWVEWRGNNSAVGAKSMLGESSL